MADSEVKTLPARLSLPNGTHAAGTVQKEVYSGLTARKRAAQTWILCWGGAIGAVFLPLLHFVLVPALLFAGPIAYFVISRSRAKMLGGQGTCPACQQPFVIGAGQTSSRFYDLCTACRKEVTVEILEGEILEK